MIHIQFQLESADILALQEDVVDSSYAHEVKRKYFKWIVTFILMFATLWLWRTSTVVGIIFLVITIGFFLFASPLYKAAAKNTLKKKILKQDHSKLFQPCTMELSEQGINRILAEESTMFAWNQFTRYTTDKDHYFLYVDDLQALILPIEPNKVENDTADHYQKQLHAYLQTIEGNESMNRKKDNIRLK